MSRLNSIALVLRTQPYGEADLIIDLYTEQLGRTTVIARGALKSKRRYMGSLEPGTLIKVDYVIKSGLSTLGPCDIVSSHRRLRQDLKTLYQLYYILEIVRVVTPVEERDELLFEAVTELLAALESAVGLPDELIYAWELKLMTHLGHHLRIGRCPVTDDAPDGISPREGGVFSSRAGLPLWPIRTSALRILYRLQRGELFEDMSEQLTETDHIQIRDALSAVWGDIAGQPLKSRRVFDQLTQHIDSAVSHPNIERSQA